MWFCRRLVVPCGHGGGGGTLFQLVQFCARQGDDLWRNARQFCHLNTITLIRRTVLNRVEKNDIVVLFGGVEMDIGHLGDLLG